MTCTQSLPQWTCTRTGEHTTHAHHDPTGRLCASWTDEAAARARVIPAQAEQHPPTEPPATGPAVRLESVPAPAAPNGMPVSPDRPTEPAARPRPERPPRARSLFAP